MKHLLVTALVISLIFSVSAQKLFTKTGHIWFYSHAPLEDITAHNYQVTSVMDSKTGDIVFKVTMSAFQFQKALMQQHFNEKYVESDKFPESVFKGKITDLSGIDFTKDGTYKAPVEGDLTIHGVTQPMKADGKIEVKGGKVFAQSLFQVAVADYDIKIPSAVKDNIAKVIDVHVEIAYEPMK
ncbi:MAG TPA: YceI family protein [Chitinophagales bacterium]|nr:YceI family protein [Chitinophagales bacterium]